MPLRVQCGAHGPAQFTETDVTKTTTGYWNPLAPDQQSRWTAVEGLEGIAEEVTLSIDPITGEYTRLTRFHPGADTSAFGGKSHAYPEEVFVVAGRLYDQAFGRWLEAGDYASRPPGDVHGAIQDRYRVRGSRSVVSQSGGRLKAEAGFPEYQTQRGSGLAETGQQ